MSFPEATLDGDAVELIIQTRIADDSAPRYAAWHTAMAEMLEGQPGFLGQQVFAPSPPAQVDWIVIQRFRSIDLARRWLCSERLLESLEEVEPLFVGKDDIFLRTGVKAQTKEVSALITCRVDPDREADFLDWEHQMFRAEVVSPGFIGHRLDRPVAGVQENWVIVLTFDGEANLNRWLESPRRAELLRAAGDFQRDVTIRKGAYGFGFWFRDEETQPTTPMVIMKGNLLVLLVLYPVVYLWNWLVGGPLLDGLGVPFWLALFIGNLFSTQVTGWWAVPKAFVWFKDWLRPDCPAADNLRGWLIVLGLYAVSMAFYAYLLRLPAPRYFGL